MTLDILIGIIGIISTAVCGVAYLYFRDNVKLRYKEQRIPVGVKK